MMGITEADFTVVARIADSVLGDVKAITQQAAASTNRGDQVAERQFELRRQAVLLSGLNAVREQLSPTSWSALHSYINDRYRTRVQAHSVVRR